MKSTTDENGRRAVFSASDVKLWRRFSDSLCALEIIQRGQPDAQITAEMRDAIDAVLRCTAPAAEPWEP